MKSFMRLIAFLLVVTCISFAAAETAETRERLDDSTLLSFYDDSVFFGDSRMEAFQRYAHGVRQTDGTFLKKVTIVAAESISLFAASRSYPSSDILYYYRGRRLQMYAVAERVNPAKIFIMLGLNDPIAAKPDKGIEYVTAIISRMKETVPDAEVYFFSETPVTEYYGEKKDRPEYQDQLDVYNAILKETCETNGAHYIEISEYLKGEDNYLRLDYSSDKVCHLNDDGIAVWIQCMKDYAQQQYELGLWDPFAEAAAPEKEAAE